MKAHRFHWRHDLALLCIVGMEVIWFTPWSALLSGSASVPEHRVPWFAWLGLFLMTLVCVRWLSSLKASLGMQLSAAVLLAAGASVGLIALYGYAGYPADRSGWLRIWLDGLEDRSGGLWGLTLPALATYGAARGALLAHRRIAAHDVRSSLVGGTVAWLLYPLVAALLRGPAIAPVWGFVFVALAILGSGMAHLEEVLHARIAPRTASSGFWPALAATCAGALTGAGLLVVVSVPSWLTDGFRRVGYWILMLLSLRSPPVSDPLGPIWAKVAPDADRLKPGLQKASDVLMGAVLVGLAALVVAVVVARRRRAAVEAGPDPSQWGSGPVDFDRGLRGALRHLMGRGARARGPQPLAELGTVRQIYGSVLRLAAWRGVAREEKETPYEYQRRLDDAQPEVQAPLGTITRAYVRARYGGVKLTDAEVERLRAEWEQVREGMEKE